MMAEGGGIEIPREIADAEGVPEDLDSLVVGPYYLPSPLRRRQAGLVYLIGGVLVAIGAATVLPTGMWIGAVALLTIAAYHWIAAWDLGIRESAALEEATRAVGFPVGLASAAVGFEGWRARPIWNVLVFSAEEPPAQRGLVRVDAQDGSVVDVYSELVDNNQ